MAPERYVVLGLAHARSEWFRRVAQWANSASIPAEFVKCVSAEELRARLGSGRAFSAVLVDGGLSAVDRDLVDRAAAINAVVLVVDDGRPGRDWQGVGAAALLPADFDRSGLLDALAVHADRIGRGDLVPGDTPPEPEPDRWRGKVAVVCGPGGTGTSTVAIALAQGLAETQQVVLADLALHAEQAMLHDARDVVPGVQELVDAHRSGRPGPDDIRRLTFDIETRGYHLLLGLRRARFWTALRPRAVEAGFEALMRTYPAVVCDCDADLEGLDECGSAEVEERHVLSRTAMERADVVFVVGLPTMKGTHSLVRVVNDVLDFGVPPDRVLPVFNRAPRPSRVRAELAKAVGELTQIADGVGPAAPLFLADRKIEDAVRDGVRLPSALTKPLVGAFNGIVDNAGARPVSELFPDRVQPGTLGHWSSAEATGS